ncbi:alpha/beta fold hydrolase [Paenibacillus sp. MER 99-2]|uniref:alpha/beta fold hydrolase n=1 Tax=Paenibacillus sp. MER 99-2 TaxID=2939572 RepID=UPI00203AAB7F|nr:alpha/beta fold hydrolase [Paenibacillus sp. MER 99-2]MCM3174637.1 alpha/beta fold hydrolase [Paenibacillus sp. MER 99-2]
MEYHTYTTEMSKNDHEATTTLLTGSTGFIGKEAVKQLMDENSDLILLVRSKLKAQATLQAYGITDFSRITFVQGDLSVSGLGLSTEDYKLALGADIIIHAGGTMDVTLERTLAEGIFMNGAKEIAALAEQIHRARGLRHLIHVVGFMSPYGKNATEVEGSIGEGSTGGTTHNPGDLRTASLKMLHTESAYEHMKFEADAYIRKHAERCAYPLSVVNPSTVVGAYPTGETEQTGGIGMLVQAMSKGRMPIIPGGASHWLPLISNDVVAQTIVYLSREVEPSGGTYPVLLPKEDSPNMKELIQLMATTLDVPSPRWSAPLPIIHAAMKAGGERISGIPPESISFITKQRFDVEQTKQLFLRMGQSIPNVVPLLPHVIADLDYRLTSPVVAGKALPKGWMRTRKGDLAVLVHEGQGEPWVIVHGLMSSADEMLPLGQALQRLTGNPIWLVDLAGFGRSPALGAQQDEVGFNGQVKAIVGAVNEITGSFKLVGHSIGATIAGAVLPECKRTDVQLAVLQPVWTASEDQVQRLASKLPRRMLQKQLSRMSSRRLVKQFKRADSTIIDEKALLAYADRVSTSLRSPRIAGANADLLRWIQRPDRAVVPTFDEAARTLLVWGRTDIGYMRPQGLPTSLKCAELPYGHQFPMFHPQETARLLADWQVEQNL